MNWNEKILSILIVVGLSVLLVQCTSSDGEASGQGKLPEFTLLDSSTYNFGEVREGEPVEHLFKFKNSGKYPLILTRTSSSCGCTTPEWPTEPILPDSSSTIKVKFDTRGKSGPQLKTVTVFANTVPEYRELRLTGFVDPNGAGQAAPQ